MKRKIDRGIAIWFWIGVIMVLVQIAIGGITRLTGSGLSITKWEIVVGTLPPMSAAAWEHEFDLYKQTPQYKKINEGMDMSAFKFIYFWEYFHRLWARLIAVVFVIPCVLFWIQKRLNAELIKKLLLAFGFGLLVGLFGWIMVMSGLVNRPWVSAYKLSVHLGLAVLLWSYLIYIAAGYGISSNHSLAVRDTLSSRLLLIFSIMIFIQILLGGLMSGMKAGLIYPTWPNYHSEVLPSVLFEIDNWCGSAFMKYDEDILVPALVQVLHRTWAYVIWIYALIILIRRGGKYWIWGFVLLNIQIIIGVITLLNCKGQIPLWYGIIHQMVGMLTFGYFVVLYTLALKPSSNLESTDEAQRTTRR